MTCNIVLFYTFLTCAIAIARPGSEEPRGLYPLGRDIRGSPAGIREDDKGLREVTCQLPDVCPYYPLSVCFSYTSFRLSELLYLPLPSLPTTSQKTDSILIGSNNQSHLGDDTDEILTSGGKWEDEEERRFFEDIQDLKDFVPKSMLGLESDTEGEGDKDKDDETDKIEKEKIAEEVRKLEEELEGLKLNGGSNGHAVGAPVSATEDANEDDDGHVTNLCPLRVTNILCSIATPTPGSPKASTPPLSPQLVPQGPTQLLTSLLARLPDATNRALVDQAAVDFAFLNSKAARKRLVRVSHSRLYIFFY